MKAVTARSSGICPLCSTYIQKRRSKIVALFGPTAPRCTPDGRFSLDDGSVYNADGKPINQREREWCHERCEPRYWEEPKYDWVQRGSRYYPIERSVE